MLQSTIRDYLCPSVDILFICVLNELNAHNRLGDLGGLACKKRSHAKAPSARGGR